MVGPLTWVHGERGMSLFAAGRPQEEAACAFCDFEHVSPSRSDAFVTKFSLVSYAFVYSCHPSRCVDLSSTYIERLYLSHF